MVKYRRTQKFPDRSDWSRKLILGSALTSVMLVFINLGFNYYFEPKRWAEREIVAIANDYYANYLFPKMNQSANTPEKQQALHKALANGLSPVLLRQLLLFDNERHAKSLQAFQHGNFECNTNTSFVEFHPKEPYGATDYTLTFKLNCND